MRTGCGIDVGASTTKAVILAGEEGKVVGRGLRKTGVDLLGRAEEALQLALDEAKLSRKGLQRIVSTGFGRDEVTFADDSSTEIRCHAAGAS